MIKAVIFDLDNTLVDFMGMKRQAITAAINSMIDAGLKRTSDEVQARIDVIYKDIKNLHIGVYPPTGRVRRTDWFRSR